MSPREVGASPPPLNPLMTGELVAVDKEKLFSGTVVLLKCNQNIFLLYTAVLYVGPVPSPNDPVISYLRLTM